MPNLFIIGGCNGAGKSTAAYKLLPEILNCIEYVNADSIASGISPFNPDSVSIQAGKLMIERVNYLVNNEIDFAFETTLSAKIYERLIQYSTQKGYTITLIYFWLKNPELAIARVQDRVNRGGHNIPVNVIRRRYERSIENFFKVYLPLCDNAIVYDNSGTNPIEIFQKENGIENTHQKDLWEQMKR